MGTSGSGTTSGAGNTTSGGTMGTSDSGTTSGAGGNWTGSSGTSLTEDLATLRTLTGTAFDKRYMAMMIRDHEQAIATFTSGSQSDDAQVRSFATQTLPILRAHLTHARSVNSKLSK
jgi:putative membrane protein